MEDTFNLIARALDVVAMCAAKAGGLSKEALLQAAQLKLIGGSSVKAALDVDWDDPEAQHRALSALVGEVQTLRAWLGNNLSPEVLLDSAIQDALTQLERVLHQDLEPDPDRGGQRIVRGTTKDRQLSIRDPDMRHGRKSRSRTIEGYKRFVALELEHGLILGVAIQPANQREHEASATLRSQVQSYATVEALYIDRGFLASPWTAEASAQEMDVYCRPWNVRNGGRYAKSDFSIDLEAQKVTCPAGQSATFRSRTARFKAAACDACAQRTSCTNARMGRGRTISIHRQEPLLQKLATAKKTPEGRAELRKRVPVEHSLAHICNRQGRRARYIGKDKNTFDLARYAIVENLFAADRYERKRAA